MTHAPVSGGGRAQARRTEEEQPPNATASAAPAPTPAPGAPPIRPSTPAATPSGPLAETPEQRFARAAQAMSRAAQRLPEDLAGLSSPLPPLPTVTDARPGDRRPPTGGVVESAAAAAGVTRETQLDEAAVRLAEELRVIPGIERFGATRLGDLDRSGPRALRTLWRIARDRLDTRYGDMTIGALIDRLNDQGPGGPSA
jgi:hypothetical protein